MQHVRQACIHLQVDLYLFIDIELLDQRLEVGKWFKIDFERLEAVHLDVDYILVLGEKTE